MEQDKAFNPEKIEEKWLNFWEDNKCFEADPSSYKEPFCVVMPPPNVTGVLHMGHALVDTLQDILVRYKRMKGFEALWIPGTDHAGISTQTVVERHLLKTQNKKKRDFTRQEFIDHIWDWKRQSETTILNQIKRLGCSCDWSRLRFTMDEKSSYAVRVLFKKMYDDGLIYQGDYLVNWDPIAQTALSDDEVEYEDIDSSMWYFMYPIADQKGHITIATTRPETMLGDTAIAVHPEDLRYKDLIGKKVTVPFIDRKIPIIADSYVDPKFGTGAVKITPAHDPNDYEMGHRHNLEFINILTPDGRINENGGLFCDLTNKEARENIVLKMKEIGLLERIEPHKLRVGISYRSKAIIEPYLSKQWFVKTTKFKEKLLSLVKENKVKIEPKHFESTYFHWIENLRDWCISRQILWGHRIPIWYNKKDPTKMICHAENGLPLEVEKNPDEWEQDTDVLDTWFSSSLWPFSTLGWPEKTKELEKFYPTAILVTGHDIIFFWVARMIMMGEYALEKPPFPTTFLHGLIYGKSYWRIKDGLVQYVNPQEKKKYDLGASIPPDVHHKWEKMSKSKGNVIDPIEIMEEYGTDAMRLALCASATHARQIDLDRRRFEEYKNFANKVWNGARFIFLNLDSLTSEALCKGINRDLLTLEDKWILSQLNRTVEKMNTYLENKTFDKAATCAYDFFWKEFCSYYLEICKPYLFSDDSDIKENKQKILTIVLSQTMLLMHPIAPFITEEIFSLLKQRFFGLSPVKTNDLYTEKLVEALHSVGCVRAQYPEVNKKDINPEVEETFAFIEKVIYAYRNIRGELKIPIQEKTDLHILANPKSEHLKTINENESILTSLLKVKSIHFEDILLEQKLFGSSYVIGDIKIFVPLPLHLLEKEILRLKKEKEKVSSVCESTISKLNNQSFKEKAPIQVVKKMEQTLLEKQKMLYDIDQKLNKLGETK